MQNIWYKNAIIYSVDVSTFMDGNGDGVGDFKGLTDKLDYIAGLGATCIWLLPFYDSPKRDDGYDVRDYYSVDRSLGTLGDFVEFAHLAQERGLRIIVDLVANHTSIDHCWFQQARRDPDSKYRDWYIWSKEKPADADEGMVFPGPQETTWTWDEEAQAYYFHRFYSHEPDLNMANPAVREEIQKIMGFWLQLGVSGFRVDAVPFLIEGRPDREGKRYPHFDLLEEMRAFLSWRRGDAVLLAEANVLPEDACDYFGRGDRMNMMFNFWANQHLFLSLARRDARPLVNALTALPHIPERCQWATFLRNHDELDLGRLSEPDREECFRAFGPEPNMQAYGRGIRRRLAPMLNFDRDRLQLCFSLLFSQPGSPVLWYGEEIGMGENLDLPERDSVRTPMQWSNEPHGGFTYGEAVSPTRPLVKDGPGGYCEVNVAHQQRDQHSLLNWVESIARIRRDCPEIGWGEADVLEADNAAVLAVRSRWRTGTVITLHNFSDRAVDVAVQDLTGTSQDVRELFCDRDYGEERIDPDRPFRIGPYGFRWLRLDGTRQ